MTGNKFFLDTNIIVAWLKGEKSVADKIDKVKEIYIPIVVAGDLYYGALYSIHIPKNIAGIKWITSNYSVLLVDEAVTLVYGNIKAALRKKGKPIPENYIWIAATAHHHQLIIATRYKHFKEIDSIRIKNW